MPDQRSDEKSPEQIQNEYMRGGKGRKDEVGGSGIYPASAPDVPADSEVRSEGELGADRPRQKPANEHDFKKTDQSSGSE